MRKKFRFIDEGVNRLVYWYGAWGLVTAAVTGLWSQVPFLHKFGWPELILIGIFSTAVLMLVVSGSLALWRFFIPDESLNPTSQEPLTAPHSDQDKKHVEVREPSERDDLALEELTVFTLDHVLPTIDELATLQKAMLRSQQGNTVVGDFAVRAIFHKNPNVQIMYDAYYKISELCGSPAPRYSLSDMENFVHRIEQNYRFFASQLYQITVSLGIDHRNEHEFTQQWQSWREKHGAMSTAYDVIRRSKKFNKLYRPGLPNLFNEGVA